MADAPTDPESDADEGAAPTDAGEDDPRTTGAAEGGPAAVAGTPTDGSPIDATDRSTAATGDSVDEHATDDREGGAIFESGGPEGPIEPGTPTLEGTLFVLLGALIAGGTVVHLWLLFN